jgi:uncharacterized protein YdeI (YjbR/CyaY-like superfamily)
MEPIAFRDADEWESWLAAHAASETEVWLKIAKKGSSQRAATVPPDLVDALARDEPARAFFESLGRTDRYAVILRLMKARGPAAREAQLRRMVDLLHAGQRVT